MYIRWYITSNLCPAFPGLPLCPDRSTLSPQCHLLGNNQPARSVAGIDAIPPAGCPVWSDNCPTIFGFAQCWNWKHRWLLFARLSLVLPSPVFIIIIVVCRGGKVYILEKQKLCFLVFTRYTSQFDEKHWKK